MKKVLLTIAIMVAVAVAGGLILMYSGAYSISTENHDNSVMNWFLDTGMTRSVKHHAHAIKVPAWGGDDQVQQGARHFDEMCVQCHGAPGVSPGEIAKGLWPQAPNLAKTVPDWTPAELFWITKFGVKFTAMPAWGPSHDDAKIWAIVAFLRKLPQLTPEAYQDLTAKPSSNPSPAQAAPPAAQPKPAPEPNPGSSR